MSLGRLDACRDREEALALHAGGDLDAEAALELRGHLARCAGCRQALDGLRASTDWLRGYDRGDVPLATLEELQRRVAVATAGRRPSPWLLAWAGRVWEGFRGGGESVVAVSCTLLLAGTALGLLGLRPPAPAPVGAAVSSSSRPAKSTTSVFDEIPEAQAGQPGQAEQAGREEHDRWEQEASAKDQGLRIEMATADPDVRIIWFASSGDRTR